MRNTLSFLLFSVVLLVFIAPVRAHVAVSGGIGFANQTQEVTFSVGHGCSGVDTSSIRIAIPAGVTSVRAVPGLLGIPTVEKDPAGLVTAVTWAKPSQEIVEGDPNYYKVSIRMKLPDADFTTLYFAVRQICSTPQGQTTTVDWAATPSMPDAGAGEPAASLLIVPTRSTGWNKYTIAQPIADLKAAFGDAQIVWKGNAAYSANPAAAELITITAGVVPLSSLSVGDIVWVKY